MNAMIDRQQIRQTQRVRLLQSAPMVGFVAIALCTILAVAFIPADIFPRHAMFWPGLFMTIGVLIVPAFTAVLDYRSVFRTENVVMAVLVFLLILDLLQGAYYFTMVSADGVRGAFYAIGLFVGGFWLSNLFRPSRVPSFIRTSLGIQLSGERLFSIALVFFCLAMFNYLWACNFDLSLVVEGLLSSRFNAPWGRGFLGDWSSFRDHLQYFGYMLPLLAVAIAMKRGWADVLTFLAIVMAVIMELFLIHGGNRRIVGATIGVSLLLWCLSQPKLSLRVVLVGGSWFMLLLLLLQLMIHYRTMGFGVLLTGEKKLEVDTEVLRVDDNFLRLAQLTELIPEKYPYAYFNRIAYTLIRPIPRVFWPDKPTKAGDFSLTEAIGFRNVLLTTSVIGDWYHICGYFGVIFGGVVYGRLSSMWSQLIAQRQNATALLVYCIGMMAVVVSLRGIDEFVLFSYPFLGWYVYTRFIYKPQAVPPAAPASA